MKGSSELKRIVGIYFQELKWEFKFGVSYG